MNRYPSYKPSGVKWLGEIPSHWEVKHLRNFLTLFSEKGYGNSQLLSVTREKGVILRDKENKGENHNFVPDDLSGYKHLEAGDFVINKMKSWQGSYGVSDYEGIVSPAYFTCKLHGVNPQFFSCAIRSKAYVGFFMQYSKGIRVDQWDLDPSSMKDIPFVLPSPDEQSAIAVYLDTATAKIDAAIAQQQKMIDLLTERKQIIINRAVTKGLNPNVKMKDSGVEWIGEVPEHWRFVRLKHLSTIISKGTTPSTIGREILSNGNIRFIKAENIVKNEVSAFPEFYIDKTTHQILKRSNLKAGDLLFVIAGATIGKVAILPEELTPANTNQAISFIRLTNRNNVKYVWLVLQSDITKKYIWENAVQSAQPNISMEDLGYIQIPLPTNEDERHKILSYVESQIEPIDKSIDSCIKQISLLQERKQIIINEVVTGKVKVG